MSLYAGESLVVSPAPSQEVTVRTSAAKAVLADARVEFAVPDEDAVTVTVFAGEATVTSEGRTRRIRAGQRDTFRRGGKPAELTDAEQHWRDLIEGTGDAD